MTRVLVVEPDADTRALYSECLRQSSFEVIEAADGAQALALVVAERPAAVITELRVPRVDGYGLCEVLRSDPATANIVIVIATTEGREQPVARCRQLADAVFQKPFDVWQLGDAIRAALANQLPRTGNRSSGQPTLGEAQPNRNRARSMHRFVTTVPPTPPPPLQCPSCDHRLVYERSRVGGVNEQHVEQWDD